MAISVKDADEMSMSPSTIAPFFSVVIPTYNRCRKLKRAISSVIDQTFQNFELLIMDDGSTDDTPKMVADISDPRVYYEWSDNSGGPATPRNRGINAAKGKWICFLDADDIWYPEKLEFVFQAILNRPDTDVFCHNEMIFIEKTNFRYTQLYGPYERDFYRILLTQGNRLSTSATTVRKTFLYRHNLRFNQAQDYVIVEDYDLWLRIAQQNGRFCFLNTALGEYIIENGNISQDYEKMRNNQKALLRDHVFQLQAFEPDKNMLWRQISVRLAIQDCQHSLTHRYCLLTIPQAIITIFSSPMGCWYFFFLRIRRYLREKIMYVNRNC